jgi:hypothetical protein
MAEPHWIAQCEPAREPPMLGQSCDVPSAVPGVNPDAALGRLISPREHYQRGPDQS